MRRELMSWLFQSTWDELMKKFTFNINWIWFFSWHENSYFFYRGIWIYICDYLFTKLIKNNSVMFMMYHREKLNTLILINTSHIYKQVSGFYPNSRKSSRSILIECKLFSWHEGNYFCYGGVWIWNGDYLLTDGWRHQWV